MTWLEKAMEELRHNPKLMQDVLIHTACPTDVFRGMSIRCLHIDCVECWQSEVQGDAPGLKGGE